MKKRYHFSIKNWLCVSLLIAFVFSVPSGLQAQNGPAIQWDKTLGGSSLDRLSTLQQTSDGGFILGGSSQSPISGDKSQPNHQPTSDYWVIKTNINGTKIWDRTYGTPGQDYLGSVIQTSDGGYLLGGTSDYGMGGNKSEASKGYDDFWIIKLDTNGHKLWDKSFGGNGADRLNTMLQTTDGGYILGGISNSSLGYDKTQIGLGLWDYWIVKIDASGNKLWDKTFGGNGWDILMSLQQTSDGGYFLGGWSESPISIDKTQASKGQSDYWVIRLDATGNKLWDKTIGGSWDDALYSCQQTTDGGFILGGYSRSGISGDKSQPHLGAGDYWIVKLNGSGNIIWDKTIGSIGQDQFYSICQTTDGGFILGGYSYSGIGGDKTQASKGRADYWVVKVDLNGNQQWDKTIGGNKNDQLISLIQTNDSGYLIGGFSESDLGGDKSEGNKGNGDIWIVKLAPEVLSTKKAQTTFALSLSPNPSQGKFNLHLSGLTAPIADVSVTDLLGRVVLQEQFKTTNAQLSEEINLPNAKGIYLLQLRSGDQMTTRKIVAE